MNALLRLDLLCLRRAAPHAGAMSVPTGVATQRYTMQLPLLLLLVASATAQKNITVTPTTVATEIPTVLTVVGSGFVANGSALCSILSLDNTFVGINYGPVGDYNCMKRVPATVINTTHLTCSTVSHGHCCLALLALTPAA